MASSCIQSCVNDTRAPVRATYVNLYKWPESDAEFIRSMSSSMRKGSDHGLPRARVVDSISCRQMYLRSYTFSREEEDHHIEEKTKCLGRAKNTQGGEAGVDRRKSRLHGGGGEEDRRNIRSRGGGGKGRGGKRRKCGRLRKVKEVSCNALVSIFRRLLFCTTKVDVVN
ncbi:hypothetical protein LIER_23883 [Lithospermum erythrorhizon]|uniref:Uncharacterized protein n=1 Tax=Lithospermum erythrorhizon TaxID=34254 RepID=A0AAV3R0K6_LITER